MLEHSARQKGLTLELDIRSDLPEAISGDPTRLRQELAKSRPCIIIGKCANHILRDRANVLSVYVEAP